MKFEGKSNLMERMASRMALAAIVWCGSSFENQSHTAQALEKRNIAPLSQDMLQKENELRKDSRIAHLIDALPDSLLYKYGFKDIKEKIPRSKERAKSQIPLLYRFYEKSLDYPQMNINVLMNGVSVFISTPSAMVLERNDYTPEDFNKLTAGLCQDLTDMDHEKPRMAPSPEQATHHYIFKEPTDEKRLSADAIIDIAPSMASVMPFGTIYPIQGNVIRLPLFPIRKLAYFKFLPQNASNEFNKDAREEIVLGSAIHEDRHLRGLGHDTQHRNHLMFPRLTTSGKELDVGETVAHEGAHYFDDSHGTHYATWRSYGDFSKSPTADLDFYLRVLARSH